MRADLILGADALGVFTGLVLLALARQLPGVWLPLSAAGLGLGFVSHRGYWGLWRFAREAGYSELATTMLSSSTFPTLATTLYIAAPLAACVAWSVEYGRRGARWYLAMLSLVLVVWMFGALSPELWKLAMRVANAS